MPNYLALGQSVANAVSVGQDFDVSGQQLQNAGINAGAAAITALSAGQDPISAAIGSGLGSIPGANTITSAVGAAAGALGIPGLSGLGGLGGTKPMALHTEYATGEAEWTKPYGMGTDIVFYLQRAGGGESSTSESPAAPFTAEGVDTALGSTSGMPDFDTALKASAGADIATGFSLPDGMSSSLNQVGSAASLAGEVAGFSSNAGLAGPLTGLTEGLSTAAGVFNSASAAISNSTASSVFNAVGSTAVSAAGLSDTLTTSLAASEAFFNETLTKSFNNTDLSYSLDFAPVAEFSSALASATGGVTSTTDFIEGINYSAFGYTSSSAAAEASRVGPQGIPARTK